MFSRTTAHLGIGAMSNTLVPSAFSTSTYWVTKTATIVPGAATISTATFTADATSSVVSTSTVTQTVTEAITSGAISTITRSATATATRIITRGPFPTATLIPTELHDRLLQAVRASSGVDHPLPAVNWAIQAIVLGGVSMVAYKYGQHKIRLALTAPTVQGNQEQEASWWQAGLEVYTNLRQYMLRNTEVRHDIEEAQRHLVQDAVNDQIAREAEDAEAHQEGLQQQVAGLDMEMTDAPSEPASSTKSDTSRPLPSRSASPLATHKPSSLTIKHPTRKFGYSGISKVTATPSSGPRTPSKSTLGTPGTSRLEASLYSEKFRSSREVYQDVSWDVENGFMPAVNQQDQESVVLQQSQQPDILQRSPQSNLGELSQEFDGPQQIQSDVSQQSQQADILEHSQQSDISKHSRQSDILKQCPQFDVPPESPRSDSAEGSTLSEVSSSSGSQKGKRKTSGEFDHEHDYEIARMPTSPDHKGSSQDTVIKLDLDKVPTLKPFQATAPHVSSPPRPVKRARTSRTPPSDRPFDPFTSLASSTSHLTPPPAAHSFGVTVEFSSERTINTPSVFQSAPARGPETASRGPSFVLVPASQKPDAAQLRRSSRNRSASQERSERSSSVGSTDSAGNPGNRSTPKKAKGARGKRVSQSIQPNLETIEENDDMVVESIEQSIEQSIDPAIRTTRRSPRKVAQPVGDLNIDRLSRRSTSLSPEKKK